MTTYTVTQEITTPNQTLDTVTISSPTGPGVNIHTSGSNIPTGFTLSNFDIGSTPDSAILNQLGSQTPGGHIHDGVVHHVTHSGISYGTHGIYDKGADTLVERVDGHHITGGQAFSPRWGNRYFQCTAHDTGFAFGHFNYGIQAGTLRIRECVAYAMSTGGWIFYSEGVWYDTDGNILGDSTTTIELDHCTFDVSNLPNGSLNFSDCHADQYVTNCVLISNTTLGNIIRSPPGFTVHTDGTIVLTPAQAATWLSAAPNYVPVAGAGSPVIGQAGPSPAGCAAAWGNLPDIGVGQAAATPPLTSNGWGLDPFGLTPFGVTPFAGSHGWGLDPWGLSPFGLNADINLGVFDATTPHLSSFQNSLPHLAGLFITPVLGPGFAAPPDPLAFPGTFPGLLTFPGLTTFLGGPTPAHGFGSYGSAFYGTLLYGTGGGLPPGTFGVFDPSSPSLSVFDGSEPAFT